MGALPIGEPIKDLLADTMYVCKDYSGTDRFWLSLQVLDVPTNPKQRDSFVQGFQGLAQQVGSIFPVALPYAMLAGAAAGAVGKFVDATSKNMPILDRHVELDPGTRHNRVLLRAGSYVFFHADVDGSAYQLESNGTITSTAGAPESIAYAVFSIEFTDDPGPEWHDEVNAQRVATLLTGLREGESADPGAASSAFLSETMQMYSNWKDLQRHTALYQKQQEAPNALTPQEQALMTSIAQLADLQPYLPHQ